MDYGMDAYENRMTVDFDNAYSEHDYAYDGYRAYQAELDRAERENDARDARNERRAGEYEDVEVGGAYITDEFKGYLRGCAIKYLWRCNDKGTCAQDIQKARAYVEKLLEQVEG